MTKVDPPDLEKHRETDLARFYRPVAIRAVVAAAMPSATAPATSKLEGLHDGAASAMPLQRWTPNDGTD